MAAGDVILSLSGSIVKADPVVLRDGCPVKVVGGLLDCVVIGVCKMACR